MSLFGLKLHVIGSKKENKRKKSRKSDMKSIHKSHTVLKTPVQMYVWIDYCHTISAMLQLFVFGLSRTTV